jgi:hypothetical protein
MSDCYIVLDGARVVGVSARLQGAELIRVDAAKRLARGEWAQNGRDPDRWRECEQRMYERLRIENHELQDM